MGTIKWSLYSVAVVATMREKPAKWPPPRKNFFFHDQHVLKVDKWAKNDAPKKFGSIGPNLSSQTAKNCSELSRLGGTYQHGQKVVKWVKIEAPKISARSDQI